MKLLKNKKWLGLVASILLLAVAYYQFVFAPTHTISNQPAMQTAVARRGDLIITASGTGTLIAAKEYDLGFTTGGQVTGVFVKAGDQVKAGDLLAQVDNSQAQAAFDQAKRNYQELTSDAAIASALQAVADAESKLTSAKLQLEYLISPDVMYWESEVERAEQAVKSAQEAVAASPSDAQAQQALKDAQAYLDFAKYKLDEAQKYYKRVYVYQYFYIVSPKGAYLALPTDLEIFRARAAIVQAQKDLQEAKYLYAALTGQTIPADASSAGLTALYQAKADMDSAQATLDGTRIVAPADGTIMSVSTSPGNTVDSTAVIVLADVSQVYLQIYIDSSDWDKIAVGKDAEVTFDALPDSTFTGKVTQVDSELYASRDSTSLRGLVLLDQSLAALNLPLGVSASVDVVSAQARNAVLVPVEALHKAGDQYTVFVVENGKPALRVVEVGLQDLVSAQIISGLQEGEVVTIGNAQTQ